MLVTRTMRRWGWALAVSAGLGTAGCGYNTIQTYDEQVNAAASQIKVQLQRRADLIPNLVETVKGYAKQEQTVFTEVAEARSRLAGAERPASRSTARSIVRNPARVPRTTSASCLGLCQPAA